MHTHRLLSSTSGIVLAGTFPWAKSPFERLAPRPLVPVAHRPLIGFSLAWLQAGGITRAAICTNRNSRAIAAQLADSQMVQIDVGYCEDPMPRGAAGCVGDAAQFLGGEQFLVTDAASLPNFSMTRLLEQHCASGAAVTVATYGEGHGPGQAALQVPSGVYVFSRRAIAAISPHGFVDIKEHLLPALARAGERVDTFAVPAPVPRVLDAATYLAVNDLVIHETVSGRSSLLDYESRGEALVHRHARVAADVTLAGPILVAAGARIGGRAVIVGPSSIGCDVVVEPGAVVARSAVWRRSVIGSDAVVDRAILGDDANVAAGRHVYRSVVPGAYRRRMVEALVSAVNVAAPSQSPRSAA